MAKIDEVRKCEADTLNSSCTLSSLPLSFARHRSCTSSLEYQDVRRGSIDYWGE